MRRDRIDAPGNQRGALSPAVAILAVMIFALAGLVIDGGRQLGARSRAVGYAQEAARAGAAAIVLNSDQAKIDVTKAGQAVAAFCAEVATNDPAVTDCATTKLDAEHLSVHVRIDNKTTFLGMVGIQSLEANGTGEAHAEQGIEKADDTPTIPPLTVIPASEDPGVPVNPTAAPPMPDVPCPTWTVGSPSPTPTWDPPIPFPATCTPNVTLPPPPDDPPAPPPTEPPPPPGGPPEPPPAGGG
jgi:Flp pilus assembly protein TadG